MDSIDELAEDLDDSKVLLTIEEDDWNGVCHPVQTILDMEAQDD